jgi:ATP-dependent Lon protease
MADEQARNAPPLPPDALVIVPVRKMVLFPGLVAPITVGRPRSIAAAQQAVREQRQIGILMQRVAEVADPAAIDLHRFGSVANVVRYMTAPDGSHHLICQGQERFQIVEFLNGWPFFVARVLRILDQEARSTDIEARFVNLRGQALEAAQLLPQAPEELVAAISNIASPGALADFTAGTMDIAPEEKQEILETVDIGARIDKVSRLLAHRIEVLRLSQEIGRQTKAALDERQREVLLREQMAAIQKQLGEGDAGKGAEMAELSEAITKAKMPKDIEEQARRELRRLERMPEAAAEYGMVRTYLDWLIELPWDLPEEQPIDIAEARRSLDEDHYGLDKIKRRIIEYLAVRLAPQGKAPILCFVGPPGVGKTSLGQSIARAMNRKFVRVSLGGVHDEAEIRGHRRTYIGAMPGNIIQAIRKAGARNCVMMLDEIDKLGAGIQGDPSAALLEVLDPEQNNTFLDHYLDVPRSSRVVFIHYSQYAEHRSGAIARPHGDHFSRAIRRRGSCRSRAAICCAGSLRPTVSRSARSSLAMTCCARSSRATRARRACVISSARSARCCATRRSASRKGRADRSGSVPPTSPPSWGLRSSKTKRPCAQACRALRPGSHGRQSAAIFCSSRQPACLGPAD